MARAVERERPGVFVPVGEDLGEIGADGPVQPVHVNVLLIVSVSASWADAAPGARAIASVRTAAHRKSFNCLIGLFLSLGLR